VTLALGLDVGGTKICGAVVDLASGRVERSARVATRPAEGGETVLRRAVALAEDLAAGQPATVGIGICELVDRDGALASGLTIDWRDLDVAAAFAGVGRATLESDVRAAALAEARFGAGRGAGHCLYVTVGTGISYCLLVAGVPYLGANGEAIVLGAPPVETVASGKAIAARAGVASAEDAFSDPACAELIASAAAALGSAVAALVNALDPGLVVFGGGLGLRDDYREAAIAAARPQLDRDPSRVPPFVPARTGACAGAVGAALAGAGLRSID
jgi:glucokinase